MKISATIMFVFASLVTFSQKAAPALEILSSSNDEKVLYRGFNNLVEIKTADGDSTDYYLLGSNCYVTRMDPSGEKLPFNQYIVKPGKKDFSNINIAVTENGVSKMLARETFTIKNVPPAMVYLDTYKDGDVITRDVELIQITFDKKAGFRTQFGIKEWSIMINGVEYTGSNHVISSEVSEVLQKVPSGTSIEITVTSEGNDGVARKCAATYTVK